jgi:hypothetical protein
MVDSDSDDYELMPSHELDDLRHEVSILKKGSLTDGDKARVLIESMDRLTISINRLITILDDAQKDIIDEYQESKPAQKLSQILEQNELIAKALVAVSDNLTGGNYSNASNNNASGNPSIPPIQEAAPASIPGVLSMPSQNAPMSNPRSILPLPNQQINNMNSMPPMNRSMPQYNQNPQMNSQFGNQFNQMPMGLPPMSSMEDLPPMDEVPSLDAQAPMIKKKFLGF